MDWIGEVFTPSTVGVILGIVITSGLPVLGSYFKDKRDLRRETRSRRLDTSDMLIKSLAALQAAIEMDGIKAQERLATSKPGETKFTHPINELQAYADVVTSWRLVILQSTNLQAEASGPEEIDVVINETFLKVLKEIRTRGTAATNFIPGLLNTWIDNGKLDIAVLDKINASL